MTGVLTVSMYEYGTPKKMCKKTAISTSEKKVGRMKTCKSIVEYIQGLCISSNVQSRSNPLVILSLCTLVVVILFYNGFSDGLAIVGISS